MSLIAIIAIALALAIDAFVVSLATGIRLQKVTYGQTLKTGLVFGGFQFLMPITGWMLGIKAHKYIEPYDHWIAFVLLAFIAGHMMYEALYHKKTDSMKDAYDPTSIRTLIILGIATSLDALAVGLSLAMMNISIWFPAIIIGIICFILSAVGLNMGWLINRMPGLGSLSHKANILGGIILLVIGVNILYQHGVFVQDFPNKTGRFPAFSSFLLQHQ